MTSGPSFQNASSPRANGSGGVFFLLALFAGVLGGAMGLPFLHVHPSAGVVVSHALLMAFYVVSPAFLGGLAQWFLPALLGGEGMALPLASRLAAGVLALGVFLLPVAPVAGLALWAFGVLALSFNVLATVLEMRGVAFRDFPPLVWAFLGNALSSLVIAPVLLAFLLRGGATGNSPEALLSVLRGGVEMTLLSVPSLGIIASLLLPRHGGRGMVARLAPCMFGIMALVPVLFWADHLFGGIGSTVYQCALMAGLALPCTGLLAGLAVDLWRARLPSGAAAGWAAGGLVLLLAGWLAMLAGACGIPTAMGPDAFTLGAGGHQLVMFGGLLALGAAFYGWCGGWAGAGPGSRDRFAHGRFLARFGTLHGLVTFTGGLCSVLPQLALPAAVLMGSSLLMFALPAGQLCHAVLTARRPGPAAALRR